ncbi:MAG: hypothetical protein AAF411_25765 [Myxococcota bacterium]
MTAVAGASVPDRADLVIEWSVTYNPPGDYVVISDPGELSDGQWTLPVPEDLPRDVLNFFSDAERFGFGVGTIVAYRPGEAPANGRVDDFDALPTAIGATDRYAIIYRQGQSADLAADAFSGESEFEDWILDFPEGLSCGRGRVDPTPGGFFDYFEPVPCSEVELRFGNGSTDIFDDPAFEFVNWT